LSAAQFAYPKSLSLPWHLVPFTLAELDARLNTLIVFGVDIFLLRDNEGVRLWKNGSGYDAAGLDYIIQMRQKHYLCQQRARTVKRGDRVAVLGRGIAVVEQADDKEALVVLGNRLVLRIARKDIVLNQQNMRWECESHNA
jgi:preprotein translocase subunit YajC